MVAVVTAVLVGRFAGLLCSVLFDHRLAPALSAGAVVAVAALVALTEYQRAAWIRTDSEDLGTRASRDRMTERQHIPRTMRAVVLDAPGPPEALTIRELPVPRPKPGWVLIEVKAFGLNRSELHTRLGLAEGVTFPRVLGIEATGIVADCPGGSSRPGTRSPR